MERLQKVIASSGVCSRRKAEELIVNGKVKVNGKVVTELGTKVDSKDEIEVNDKLISKEEKEYYLLNKPRGVITSTSDDKGRTTVVDLIDTTPFIISTAHAPVPIALFKRPSISPKSEPSNTTL